MTCVHVRTTVLMVMCMVLHLLEPAGTHKHTDTHPPHDTHIRPTLHTAGASVASALWWLLYQPRRYIRGMGPPQRAGEKGEQQMLKQQQQASGG